MYSLIIAEDEEIERRALKLFITKNFPNVLILDDVSNGIELVQRVEELKPDIAIVDINMPGLSGLEAIKTIKLGSHKAKIIIHTAYNYFEYAQQALSFGADEYILKPEKRDKVIETISKCISKIEEERRAEAEKNRLDNIISEITPILETDFMTSILLGDSDCNNFKIYMDILRIKFNLGYIMTIALEDYALSKVRTNELEKNELKKEIINLIKTEMGNLCTCIVSPIISNKISAFVVVEEELSDYSFKVWSMELGELIVKRLENVFGVRLCVGIGQLYDKLELLTKSYKESIYAINDKTVSSYVKHFSEIFNDVKAVNPFFSCENEMISNIIKLDLNGSKLIINKIFNGIEPVVELDEIKDMALGLVLSINKSLSEEKIFFKNNTSSKLIYKEIMKLRDRIEIKKWLEELLASMIDQLTEERKSKISNFVKNGIYYINKNYCQDISLENVAESIGVSPYYLSRLFKQELRKNFVDYLTEVRINQALKLLKERNYSIRELSEKVGYANPTYFCKVFKKHTGKTIGEVKEKVLDF